ncbi:MAG: hypothetical protein ACXAE3_08170 [Candidatus Kariarchaeaceae archaeon]|jgi:hypothetical protein
MKISYKWYTYLLIILLLVGAIYNLIPFIIAHPWGNRMYGAYFILYGIAIIGTLLQERMGGISSIIIGFFDILILFVDLPGAIEAFGNFGIAYIVINNAFIILFGYMTFSYVRSVPEK